MAEIDIVSTETIRPSSPTPDRLKKFGLSVFDHFQTDAYIPIVFFYNDGGQSGVSGRIRRLKVSLSETLVRFYPVAGRVVKEDLSVDCDDGGVEFVEARVNGCGVSDILVRPDYEVLRKLLPRCSVQGGAHPLLRVQANVFECGGLAIGALFGHKIMDTCGMRAFLLCWAAVARGDSDVLMPDLDAVASRFPAIPITLPEFQRPKACECSMRRFVFEAASIDTLRDKIANKSSAERPTRVTAVSALVWRCIVNALTKRPGHGTRPTIVTQMANVRRRLEPPLSEHSLGNMVVPIFAESSEYNELQGLARQLRQGLRDLTHNDVTKLKGSEDAMTMMCERVEQYASLYVREDVDSYRYTSWCGFGLYEVDFGWGRPTWFTAVYSNVKNSVIMMDTKGGDGIAVLTVLPKRDMTFFETDPELLEFASLNPSVCC